jgi:hypothetical protein
MNSTRDDLARHLADSIESLQKQVAKVEFWASVMTGFAQPVPDYEPETTQIGRYVRPGRLRRKRRHRAGTRGERAHPTPTTREVTPASA